MSQPRKCDVVVITGASAGVGRATAKAFAKLGARIGLIARGKEGLEGAMNDVNRLGGKAIVLQADVADSEQIENAADRVENELGPIDIWINDAMTTVFSYFMDIHPDEFKRVTEVVYLGFVNGTRAALKRMIPRNQGTIVQVGSALAYRGIPLQSAYCGAKHAIQGFTESLRSELIHNKNEIHISMVQMPALNTPQFKWCKNNLQNKAQPVPPIYQPEAAADAIVYAAYHKQREVYVGGKNSVIIWGNKFLPGVGDWYLAKTGIKSQQTDQPADKNRPYNLWEPVHEDYGAHGDFDKKASSQAVNITTDMNRSIIVLSGLAVLGLVAFGVRGLLK